MDPANASGALSEQDKGGDRYGTFFPDLIFISTAYDVGCFQPEPEKSILAPRVCTARRRLGLKFSDPMHSSGASPSPASALAWVLPPRQTLDLFVLSVNLVLVTAGRLLDTAIPKAVNETKTKTKAKTEDRMMLRENAGAVLNGESDAYVDIDTSIMA